MEGHKHCSECKKALPLEQFGLLRTRGKVRSKAQCKKCLAAIQRTYIAKHKETIRINKKTKYETQRMERTTLKELFWEEPRKEDHKRCTKCDVIKLLGEFPPSKSGKFGVGSRCKKCVAAYRKDYHAEHREFIAAQMKMPENVERRRIRTRAHRAANLEVYRAKDNARHAKHGSERNAQNRARRAANPEVYRAKENARYYKNHEKKREQYKRQYWRHVSIKRAYSRAYFATHKEDQLAKSKIRYETNKPIYSARQKAYYVQNAPTIRVRTRAYYVRKKEAIASKVKEYRRTPKGRAIEKAHFHNRRTRAQFAFDRLAIASDFRQWMEDGAVCYLTGDTLSSSNLTLDHIVPLKWGGTHDLFNIAPASRTANSTKLHRIVYFDLATRKVRYTLDPCPGGPTWPRIPLTQPTLDEMEAMVTTSKERRKAIVKARAVMVSQCQHRAVVGNG